MEIDEADVALQARYLVLLGEDSPALLDAIAPLVEWRRAQGYAPEIFSIGGEQNQIPRDQYAIRSWIASQFNPSAYRLFVILVGDQDLIPSPSDWVHPTRGDYLYCDHWYACIVGDDDIADVNLGRFSSNTPGVVSAMVQKVMYYERSLDPGWNRAEALMVSHQITGYRNCKERIATGLESHGVPCTRQHGKDAGVTNSSLTDKIDSQGGFGLLNYRGHGLFREWNRWNRDDENFRNEEIRQLTNATRPPLIYEICCDCGNLYDEGHSETWAEHAGGGGVGVWGATRASFTIANHTLDESLCAIPHTRQMAYTAEVMNTAKLEMLEIWPDDYGHANNRMYHFIGDPALQVWSGTGTAPSISHLSAVPAGTSWFPVVVRVNGEPVRDALVCLTALSDPTVHYAGYTGPTGRVDFTISVGPPGMQLQLTVTGRNLLPYFGLVYVAETALNSNSPWTTGSSNARHFVRDTVSGALHLVFQDQTHVYYAASTNDGASWTREDLGPGQWPCIDLDFDQRPWVVYRVVDGPNQRIVAKVKSVGGTWVEQELRFSNDTELGAPTFVLSNMRTENPPYPDPDFGYVVYAESFPSHENPDIRWSRLKALAFDDNGPCGSPVKLDERVGLTEYCLIGNPSIARTPSDSLHIAWQRPVGAVDSVFYRTSRKLLPSEVRFRNGLSVENDFSPAFRISPGAEQGYLDGYVNPFVEAYEDSVFVVMSNANGSQPPVPPIAIRQRRRYIGELTGHNWSFPRDVRYDDQSYVDNAAMSTKYVTAWQEEGGDELDGEVGAVWSGESKLRNLSSTPGNVSKSPHVDVQLYDGNPSHPHEDYIRTIWTEEVVPGELYEVKYSKRKHVHVPPGRMDVVTGPFAKTDVPLALARIMPDHGVDSARLFQEYYGTGGEVLAADTTPWFFVGQVPTLDTCWQYLHGPGKYRMACQTMDSTGSVSPVFWAMQDTIVFDSVAPGCQVTINNGERFVTQPQVPVQTTLLDSTDAPFEMRFANGPLAPMVQNRGLVPGFGSWEYSAGGGYGSGLEMGEVVLSQEHETWVRQVIPCGAFPVGHLGRQYRLSADLLGLAKSYWGQLGWLEFGYTYLHSDTAIHDTCYQWFASTTLNGPMEARVGLNRAFCDFLLPEPNPDPNLVWQGGIVRLRCPALPMGATGTAWLDNVSISPFGQFPQTSWWQSFQPGYNWQLDPLVTGEHTVSVAYRDNAGNETWPAFEDTVVLDMQQPIVFLQSPPAGYYLSDTASLAGWAFDWPSPAGDTYFLSYRLDFRYPDSANWQPVDPDSVSYQYAWPDTTLGTGWFPRHLGYWNTTLVPDGPYLLRVVGTDSAMNQMEHVSWAYVRNDTGTDDCTGTSSSATSMGSGSVYVGTATGKLLHYSEDLDSLGYITISDSLGNANITAMLSVGNDSVIAADVKNLCIHKLRKNGQGRRRFASYPGLIAAATRDAGGNIWAIDQSRSLLAKVRPNGTLAFTRGGQNADSIERLKNPEGMAVRGEMVYVSDTRNNRLAVWDTAGNFTRAIPLGFMPQAVLVTDSGAIYTVNKTAGTIVGVNAQGRQFYRIEKRNSNPHKHLVLSDDQHYLFTYQPVTKELLKYQIQSNESMPGGQQSGGETSLQPMLHACRPNPFSNRTLISYQFPKTGRVVLRVYDASGRVVKTLQNGMQERGSYTVSWDGRDERGRTVANGVYFYRVDAPGLKDTKKAVVTK